MRASFSFTLPLTSRPLAWARQMAGPLALRKHNESNRSTQGRRPGRMPSPGQRPGKMARSLFLLLLPLFFLNSASASDKKFPIKGRPENFSFIEGQRFSLFASVDKATVRVEQPFLLTITLKGRGKITCPPTREKLKVLPPEFEKQFFVRKRLDKDGFDPKQQKWSFVYELRPKGTDVTMIPSLELSYYSQGYRKAYTGYIKLKVLPPPPPIEPPPTAIDAPEDMYNITTGKQLLRDARKDHDWPSLAVSIPALLLPLCLCVLWYVVWRYRYPDEALRVQRRQSGAARKALRALRRVRKPVPGQTEAIVSSYLQDRFDFHTAEPTPEETESYLRTLGLPSALCVATAEYLRVSQRHRFAPEVDQDQPDWNAQAANLIRELEVEHGE